MCYCACTSLVAGLLCPRLFSNKLSKAAESARNSLLLSLLLFAYYIQVYEATILTLDYGQRRAAPPTTIMEALSFIIFWTENSEAWFGIAESRFCLRNIKDEQVNFDLVVNALPKECLMTVLDLVTNPP